MTTGAATIDLGVAVGRLSLDNPVMPASGCFGPEIGPVLGTALPGAVVTKTVFAQTRSGNRAPRLAETPYGMLNSVGIPSPGSTRFIADILPAYQVFGVPVIASLGGLVVDEYYTIADDLAEQQIAAFELNVSCPNLEHGGTAIGTSPDLVHRVVAGVRARTDRLVSVKLTPVVSSIAEVAQAAEDAGADAIVVANSLPGLAIDVQTRTSTLGNGTGGYTGPAIKPIALKLVRDVTEAVSIPVIGCGGITNTTDVLEFMIVGASAVQVGTASFTRPSTMNEIVNSLPAACHRLGVSRIADLVGTLHTPRPQEIG